MRICNTYLFSGSLSLLLVSSALNAESPKERVENQSWYKNLLAHEDNGVAPFSLIAISKSEAEKQKTVSAPALSPAAFFSDKVPKSPSQVKDYQLTLQAQNALKGGLISVGYENVKVNIKDGNATITGYVENENARKDVIRRILDIDGIVDIQDLLSLNGVLSSADRQLTLRVRETLKGGIISRNYDTIVVNVLDGRAIVQGTIENDNDQNDIFERILAIEEVQGIDNQLIKRSDKS